MKDRVKQLILGIEAQYVFVWAQMCLSIKNCTKRWHLMWSESLFAFDQMIPVCKVLVWLLFFGKTFNICDLWLLLSTERVL